MGYSHPIIAGDAVTLPLYFPSQLVRLFLYYYYTAWLPYAIGPLPTPRGPGSRPLYPIRCTIGYLAYGRKLIEILLSGAVYLNVDQLFLLHLLHCWDCSRDHASSILILRAAQGLLRWICLIVKTNLTIQHLPQFNTCGCLLTFSLVDLFPPLRLIFLMQSYILKTLFSGHYCQIFPLYIQQYSIILPVHFTLFSIIFSFNFQ